MTVFGSIYVLKKSGIQKYFFLLQFVYILDHSVAVEELLPGQILIELLKQSS